MPRFTAANAEVEVSECCLDTDEDLSSDAAYATLNVEERARAERFVFRRDALRFVRGRGFLRRRLGERLGLPAAEAPIATGKHGKPFVCGYRTRFNLSHTDSHAVLALSSDAEVGIDIEALDQPGPRIEELDGLAQMCLNAEERRALADLEPGRRSRRFLRFWTAKEALMKLTGEGFALDPLDIKLQRLDGEPVAYAGPHGTETELRYIRVSRPGAVCCLAVGPIAEPGPINAGGSA